MTFPDVWFSDATSVRVFGVGLTGARVFGQSEA